MSEKSSRSNFTFGAGGISLTYDDIAKGVTPIHHNLVKSVPSNKEDGGQLCNLSQGGTVT